MNLARLLIVSSLFSTVATAQPTPTVSLQDADLQRLFQLADGDHNGAVSRTEALHSGLLIEQGEWFEAIDRDKSGTVTLFELSGFVAEQVQDWLAGDTDHDGRVTDDEAQRRSGSYAELVRRADANHDGAVTRDEFERLGRRMYYQHGDLPAVPPNIIEKRF